MTNKQWAKVQVIKSTMTLKITKKIYKTKAEGLQMMGANPQNYQILNNKNIETLVAQGYKIFGAVEVIEPIKVVDLTGDPDVEEAIRLYYIKKKQRQGVQWVKGLCNSPMLVEQSKISHADYQASLSSDKALSMRKSVEMATAKYYKNRKKVVNEQ